MFVYKISLLAILACAYAQQGPTTTPVPILKQINRQNDDGSYSYGYEAGDGSFKIETKYPNGDVAGKYGFVDEGGKLQEITYGASSKRGFEPQGAGIVVPPPAINDNPTNALAEGEEDDGQYREDPRIYEDPKYNGRAQSRPSPSFRQFHQSAQPVQPEPQYQSQNYQSQPSQFRSSPLFTQQTNLFSQSPQQFSQATQQYSQPPQQYNQDYQRPQSQVYHQQPQFSFQTYTPQYNQNYPQQYQNQNYNPFLSHPALQNLDPNTGSYTINFTGK